MNDVLIWDTPEHHHGEKTSDWYWSLGIIAISLAILCILLSNILLAILVLLAAFTAGLHAARPPRIVRVEVHPKGILVDRHWYGFKHIESFWIETEHPVSIILKSKKLFSPLIVIPISDDMHPDDVRDFLKSHIPEVEHHESFLHKAFEYIGI